MIITGWILCVSASTDSCVYCASHLLSQCDLHALENRVNSFMTSSNRKILMRKNFSRGDIALAAGNPVDT